MQRTGSALPLFLVMFVAASFLTVSANAALAEGNLGGMQLLPGYEHMPLQGIDSIVGKITKQGGLEIFYEIGSLPQPGGFALGGQFSDRPKNYPKDQLQAYYEQTVHGQPVHVAYTKTNQLMVSFPKKGMNLSTTVKNPAEMAEALMMILTYPEPDKKNAKGK